MRKDITIAIPHSHAPFWVQTCLHLLLKHRPPNAHIIVVDNSWHFSPSIRNVLETAYAESVDVVRNPAESRYHATGLDHVVNLCDTEWFFALETDVTIRSADWLERFFQLVQPTDFAVGAWHHEQFVNPSCTLYRTSVLKDMLKWSKENKSPIQRWGDDYEKEHIDPGFHVSDMGPFSEKRGWPEGFENQRRPSGKSKGPGWYEPGQALFAWATDRDYTFSVMPTFTTRNEKLQIPTGTHYGCNGVQDVQNCVAIHKWGGTRALDIIKHPISDPCVINSMGFWLSREAEIWAATVPREIQEQTLALIKKYGFYNGPMDDRQREAVKLVCSHYKDGGVTVETP